ncbi:hypothetical protein RSAG8_01377, partial [Rhizoctonia solani AG-8 WAC10335]
MESAQVLSWTSQDPRESSLFTTHWGVLYRFTTENAGGRMVTTLHRAIRQGREDRVAKLEWASNGGLGRAVIGRQIVPMADLVRPDGGFGSRTFNGPDGYPYQWSPSSDNQDSLVSDGFYSATKSYRLCIKMQRCLVSLEPCKKFGLRLSPVLYSLGPCSMKNNYLIPSSN